MSTTSKIDGWWAAFFAILAITLLVFAFSIGDLPGIPFAALCLSIVFMILAVYYYDRWKSAKNRSDKPRKQRR